jgi:sugar/nucleoside kinase (ribokinase family)
VSFASCRADLPQPEANLTGKCCSVCFLNTLQISRMPKQNGSRGRTVVITQGSAATVVAVNGKVTLYPVIALPAEKLVDTNGAGVLVTTA